jgi:hypothetical protein
MMKTAGSMIKCLLMCMVGMMPVKDSMASRISAVQASMQAYLAGLSNGSVTILSDLIGGAMKDASNRLLTQNTQYPQFLRTYYAGVGMTIDDMTQAGPNYQAKVRFDYPASDSITRIFTLSVVDGQWKIVHEESSLDISANAGTISSEAIANRDNIFGLPASVPLSDPPVDARGFAKGLTNATNTMPASVPPDMLPGSNFGRAVLPVPAAIWLFGSGVLGLIGISRRKKAS